MTTTHSPTQTAGQTTPGTEAPDGNLQPPLEV